MPRNSSAFQNRFRLRPKVLPALYVVLCALFLSSVVSAQEPRIVSFDAPGAGTVANNFNGTVATAINALGTVAGYYNDSNVVSHCFIRTADGKITTFDVPGADINPADAAGSIINAINAFGTTTGIYLDSSFVSHGFLRSPDGKFTTFDAPGAGGTTPLAVNLEGAIVGYYTDSNYSFHAFLRSPDGKFTTWIGPGACTGNGSEGCYGSGASNINAFGTIVGGFEDNSGNFVHHSYVRSAEGKLKTFDVPGAGTGSYQGTGCPSDCPVSINDWGAITGSYWDANYVSHGYLRSPEGKIVAVDPVGSTYTFPAGINDLGSITGYYIDANGVYHGFLRISCE